MRRFLALSSATALLLASTVGLSPAAFATTDPSGCVTDCAVAAPFVLASKPGAPTGLVATPTPYGAAVISWTDPTDTGGSELLGYPLQRSTDGITWDDNGSIAVGTVSGTFIDYGLQIGTKYYYRLAAENINGIGAYSEVATMVGQTYPRPVQNLEATYGDQNSSTLSWGAPNDDGGTPITGYVVQYAVSNNGDPLSIAEELWSVPLTAAASPSMVTGLVNNTGYIFRVQPLNAAGSHEEWSYAWATPRPINFFYNFAPNFATTGGSKVQYGSILAPGTEIVVAQSGLPVGAKLSATLWVRNGTPGAGTAIVDGTGSVRLSMLIPSDAPDGDYAITTDLIELPEGYLPTLSYTVYFEVKAAATGTTGSGEIAVPGNTVSGEVAGTVVATKVVPLAEVLANTGANTTWVASMGALLLMAGVTSTLVTRRRRV